MSKSISQDFFTKHENSLKWFVLLFAILIYSNTLTHQMALDDYSVIVTHTHVQNGINGIDEILTTNYRHGNSKFNDGLYRPLSLVSFALEKEFFNSNTTIAHLINVLIYALGCVFLFLSLKNIFKHKPIVIPLVISLLFVAHPIHTEVVANIKSRDELFAFMGFALCLFYELKFVKSKSTKHLIFAILFFLIALFSKESAVTFSVLIPLLLFLKPEVSFKKVVSSYGILFPLALLFMLLRNYIIDSMPNAIDQGNFGLLNNPIAAITDNSIKWGSSFALELIFLKKLFLPLQLIHDYSYRQLALVGLSSASSIAGLLSLIGLIAAAIIGFVKRNTFGIIAAIYLVSIVIASQIIIPIGVHFAERMLFFSALPFALFIVLLLEKLWQKENPTLNKKQQKAITGIIAVICIVFSLKTFSRNFDWKNNFSLYEADITAGENSARVNYNYGSELIDQAESTNVPDLKAGYSQNAIKHLKKAILIYPEYIDAYNNLGLAYKNSKDYKNAIITFKKGILLNPNYSKNYYNLATTYYTSKQYRKAIETMQAFTELQSNSATAFYIMGEAAGNLGEMAEAITHLNKSVKLNPNNANAFNFLGMAYGMTGNQIAAESNFTKAMNLAPQREDILMNLSLSYRNQQKKKQERIILQKVLSINPNNQQAKNQLKSL